MVKVHVSGEPVKFHGPPDTHLLWLLRDYLGLTGAKYGCGMSPALAPAVADTLSPSRAGAPVPSPWPTRMGLKSGADGVEMKP